jgi:enamine deaminase RidA (YjgF/YER057c/UK114 family)
MGKPVSATPGGFATRKYADAALRALNFDLGASVRSVVWDRLILLRHSGARASVNLRCAIAHRGISTFRVRVFDAPRNDVPLVNQENLLMLTLQPAEWSKPRGFSHGVAVDGPGRWIVLAGQTGGDASGQYLPDMAGQVTVALRRIITLLGEAGAGPEHIVRLTWYLTSRSEYDAPETGTGIAAAWRETLGRNFPPSTLLYISGLVDERAKVEIEVTAFVPTT